MDVSAIETRGATGVPERFALGACRDRWLEFLELEHAVLPAPVDVEREGGELLVWSGRLAAPSHRARPDPAALARAPPPSGGERRRVLRVPRVRADVRGPGGRGLGHGGRQRAAVADPNAGVRARGRRDAGRRGAPTLCSAACSPAGGRLSPAAARELGEEMSAPEAALKRGEVWVARVLRAFPELARPAAAAARERCLGVGSGGARRRARPGARREGPGPSAGARAAHVRAAAVRVDAGRGARARPAARRRGRRLPPPARARPGGRAAGLDRGRARALGFPLPPGVRRGPAGSRRRRGGRRGPRRRRTSRDARGLAAGALGPLRRARGLGPFLRVVRRARAPRSGGRARPHAPDPREPRLGRVRGGSDRRRALAARRRSRGSAPPRVRAPDGDPGERIEELLADGPGRARPARGREVDPRVPAPASRGLVSAERATRGGGSRGFRALARRARSRAGDRGRQAARCPGPAGTPGPARRRLVAGASPRAAPRRRGRGDARASRGSRSPGGGLAPRALRTPRRPRACGHCGWERRVLRARAGPTARSRCWKKPTASARTRRSSSGSKRGSPERASSRWPRGTRTRMRSTKRSGRSRSAPHDERLAIRFLAQEARALLDRRQYAQATVRLEEALGVAADDPGERAELLLDLAATIYHAGDEARCESLLEESLRAAAAAGREDLARIARGNRVELLINRCAWETAAHEIAELETRARPRSGTIRAVSSRSTIAAVSRCGAGASRRRRAPTPTRGRSPSASATGWRSGSSGWRKAIACSTRGTSRGRGTPGSGPPPIRPTAAGAIAPPASGSRSWRGGTGAGRPRPPAACSRRVSRRIRTARPRVWPAGPASSAKRGFRRTRGSGRNACCAPPADRPWPTASSDRCRSPCRRRPCARFATPSRPPSREKILRRRACCAGSAWPASRCATRSAASSSVWARLPPPAETVWRTLQAGGARFELALWPEPSGPAAAAVALVLETLLFRSAAEPAAAHFAEGWLRLGIVTADASMEEPYRRLTRFAPQSVTVLILGESGSGKEAVARAIHRLSARSAGPFVPVNVPAIPPALLESELFGHARGAFTGADRERRGLLEEASGGTIFFDEIGDLAPPLQAKLLRALQEREIRRVGENRSRADRRPRRLGDLAEPRARGRGGRLSRGPLLSAARRRHPPAAAARAREGRDPARPAFSGALRRASTAGGRCVWRRRPRRRSAPTPGRATSASSRTRWPRPPRSATRTATSRCRSCPSRRVPPARAACPPGTTAPGSTRTGAI